MGGGRGGSLPRRLSGRHHDAVQFREGIIGSHHQMEVRVVHVEEFRAAIAITAVPENLSFGLCTIAQHRSRAAEL